MFFNTFVLKSKRKHFKVGRVYHLTIFQNKVHVASEAVKKFFEKDMPI